MCKDSMSFAAKGRAAFCCAATGMLLFSGSAWAIQSPAGCNANNLTVDIQRDKVNIVNGETVTFTVTIANPVAGTGCDIKLGAAGLVFTCPGLDGTASGDETTLIPADTVLPGFGTGFGPQVFNIPCVVTLNDGVSVGSARVTAPNALLLDNNATPGSPANIDKSITVNVFRPCIEVTKECDGAPFAYGAPIKIKGTVTNCGDIILHEVTVVDDQAGLLFGPADLAAGASADFSGQYDPTGDLCGPFTDTVTATGTASDLDVPVEVTDDASITCEIETNPCIDITKTCPPTVAAGTTSYEVSGVVSNCGDVPLENVTVVDDGGTPGEPGDDTTIPIGNLDIGGSAPWSATVTVPEGFCGQIVNTVAATGADVCTEETVNDSANCTTEVLCPPDICVTKEVACAPDTGICGEGLDYGETATGVEGAAFCYRIVVENCGQDDLENVVVTDTRIDVTGDFPPTLAVGESVTNFYKLSFADEGTYPNTVTADGVGASSGTEVSATDSAEVVVVPISVECDIEVVGVVQPPVGNCEATLTESGPVEFTLTIRNTGEADLDVSITGVPPLKNCDTLEDIVVPTSVFIAAGGDPYVLTGCTEVTCPEGAQFEVTVQGTAVASEEVPCIFDENGVAVKTAESTCRACVNCQAEGLFCRTTGGGDLIAGTVDDLTAPCLDVHTTLFPDKSALNQLLVKVTHGGQMGAPFAAADCGEVLGNPCIKGQWQHVRHYQGRGNPRDVVSAFHAGGPGKGTFDALMCECLPCCEDPDGVNQPNGNFNGWENLGFDVCNPLDHKVCGPLPRPAPANALIWSGLGQMNQASDTGKKPAEWVVVRVYIEDRSEPGGNHPKGAVLPSDIYSFQAWRTGVLVSKKPDYTTVAPTLRRLVAEDSCAFLAGLKSGAWPIGTLPSDQIQTGTDPVTGDPIYDAAEVNDQGPLHDGNRQIHPTTSATCLLDGAGAQTN